jgi:2-C-methyl-D-erythritol 4-phosphate cytidylyltransferase
LRRDVGVIVAAAGQSARLREAPAAGAGASQPAGELKQFRPIGGVPMLLRALRPFLAHPEVETVVAVVPQEVAVTPPKWLAGLVGERLQLATGGARRADSVRCGLAMLPPACSIVLVHDGARPFPSPRVIDAVITEARAGRAAIAAVPVTDTLKEATADGRRVVRTIPRRGLWRAQTPQGFPRSLLERAHEAAAGAPATDDAELVERLGEAVVVVPDVNSNLKVTTVEDLLLAEALASLT